jgi:hypothetical protein
MTLPILPPSPIPFDSRESIKVMPVQFLDYSMTGAWLPCDNALCVKENPKYGTEGHREVCANPQGFFNIMNSCDADRLMWIVEPVCWSCRHRTLYFSNVQCETRMYFDGTHVKLWSDMIEEFEAEEQAYAAKHGIVVVKEVSELVQHVRKLESDVDYARADEMAKFAFKQFDAKRCAGKSWELNEAKICKYASGAIFRDKRGKPEPTVAYKYKKPDRSVGVHYYTECWAHEYTDPKTKQKHTPRTCNCLHPGQEGWNDAWLYDPQYAHMYDRFKEDWYKFHYSMDLKQWVYDERRTLAYADGRTRSLPQAREASDRVRTVPTAKTAPVPNTKPTGGAIVKPVASKWTSNSKKQSDDDGWHSKAVHTAAPVHSTVWETAKKRGAK